ncbi:MAG: hypothetical protein M3O09_15500, partial [Acidobacteriota bacterium]|nr:hypothetical protein [Acidobacteriota bacterium]
MRKTSQLNKTQEETHIVRARALIAAGVAIEIDQNLPVASPLLRIQHTIPAGTAGLYARPGGGIGIAISLRIVSLKPDSMIRGTETSVPWKDAGFYLQEISEKVSYYEVANGPEYPKASVLNHRLGRCLQPRQVLEGVLIARTLRRLPDFYQTGMVVPITVCFWDQLDTPYSVEVGVGVILDKAPKILRTTNPGLFEGREEPANELNVMEKQAPAVNIYTDDEKSHTLASTKNIVLT